MERRFQQELDGLKTMLIKMGSVVEENVNIALQSLLEKNISLAGKILENEKRINSLELEIDQSILDLLALQQPVASDLRFVIAAQKLNNDLERIGDHAVNIAQSDLSLLSKTKDNNLLELPKMIVTTKIMLRKALDSFILVDVKLAKEVLSSDDTIDKLNKEMTNAVIGMLRKDRNSIECGLELIRISKNLERIADITTNIAEEVIFYSQAKVVKHSNTNIDNN